MRVYGRDSLIKPNYVSVLRKLRHHNFRFQKFKCVCVGTCAYTVFIIGADFIKIINQSLCHRTSTLLMMSNKRFNVSHYLLRVKKKKKKTGRL